MKKLTLLVTIIFISKVDSTAQCNIHTQKDDFDGSVTMYTDAVKIASDGVGLLSGNNDCTYKTYLSFVTGKGKIVLVLKEVSKHCGGCSPASVVFKFDDGTIISKTNVRYSPERSEEFTGDILSSYFDLTKSELLQFSRSPIAKFRIRENMCSDHPTIELDLASNSAKKIRSNAECISANK